MEIVHYLHSIVNYSNGKRVAKDFIDYYSTTLAGEDLDQFNSDMEEIREYYVNLENSGEIVHEPIIETFSTEYGDISIRFGSVITWKNTIAEHEKSIYWLERFAAEPTVEYRPYTITHKD
jgi:hypothetical protein